MTDTIYTPEQIQQILFPVFLQYPVKKAILFGSYAKGTAETKSDIDILVDSGLKGLAFFGLLEDVVTSLEKEVDLLDVSQITPDSEIDREILKSGVVIYERER
ncbi:nucleotidyltransferase family protein [uncultured Ruminococcus sp.]|jgi:predicted nucleotidyltransferase|uniref:nucleotidyltransferase family protein n=1 Tax=uncultured Ruminococcus sp. TaxID=165186 RepID=UPI0026214ECD|nr:nucleotidyltransferase domain-containing protein [uncultured Ruminococcus sp.]